MAQQLTAKNRGAKSLKWVKDVILESIYTSNPVTGVLQVTTVTKKPDNETIQARNKLHTDVNVYIARHLNAPTPVGEGKSISMTFKPEKEGLVHYITRDGYIDILQQEYVEKRVFAVQTELRMMYPNWDIKLQYLLTKPMQYVSIGMARSVVASENALVIDMDLEEDVPMPGDT